MDGPVKKYRNKLEMKMQEKCPTKKGLCRKTRRLLYISGTDVELSSSISLPQFVCSRLVFWCFHPCLVSVLFTDPSLFVVCACIKLLTSTVYISTCK